MFCEEEIRAGCEVTFTPTARQAKRFTSWTDLHGNLTGTVLREVFGLGWLISIRGMTASITPEAISILSESAALRTRGRRHVSRVNFQSFQRRLEREGTLEMRVCFMLPIRDHKLIRQWAKEQNATPAEIRPQTFDSEPAILTFIFGNPEAAVPHIFPISWESFLAQFDLLGLSFAHDEVSSQFDIVRVEQSASRELAH